MSATNLKYTEFDFETKLVDLVQANPKLYEKDELRPTPYEDMKKKMELWNSIAESLGVDGKYCLAKWKLLRDKFRQELQKSKELSKLQGTSAGSKASTTWPLFEKMLFLKRHINSASLHNRKSRPQEIQKSMEWNAMAPLIDALSDDHYPMQEAMDEQSTGTSIEVAPATSSAAAVVVNQQAMPSNLDAAATGPVVVNMKRIETLLESLDPSNRMKAEKRIVTYLCNCQIKSLNGEDVNEIVF